MGIISILWSSEVHLLQQILALLSIYVLIQRVRFFLLPRVIRWKRRWKRLIFH